MRAEGPVVASCCQLGDGVASANAPEGASADIANASPTKKQRLYATESRELNRPERQFLRCKRSISRLVDGLAGSGFLSANERFDSAAPNLLALVDAELMSIQEVLSPDHVLVAQVDDPEVGVIAGRDVALVREPEPSSDVRGSDGRDGWQVEAVLSQ